jgi:hypothetical protein
MLVGFRAEPLIPKEVIHILLGNAHWCLTENGKQNGVEWEPFQIWFSFHKIETRTGQTWALTYLNDVSDIKLTGHGSTMPIHDAKQHYWHSQCNFEPTNVCFMMAHKMNVAFKTFLADSLIFFGRKNSIEQRHGHLHCRLVRRNWPWILQINCVQLLKWQWCYSLSSSLDVSICHWNLTFPLNMTNPTLHFFPSHLVAGTTHKLLQQKVSHVLVHHRTVLVVA